MQSLYPYIKFLLFTSLLSLISGPRYIHFATLQFTWLVANVLANALYISFTDNSVCMKSVAIGSMLLCAFTSTSRPSRK